MRAGVYTGDLCDKYPGSPSKLRYLIGLVHNSNIRIVLITKTSHHQRLFSNNAEHFEEQSYHPPLFNTERTPNPRPLYELLISILLIRAWHGVQSDADRSLHPLRLMDSYDLRWTLWHKAANTPASRDANFVKRRNKYEFTKLWPLNSSIKPFEFIHLIDWYIDAAHWCLQDNLMFCVS